MEIKIDTKKDSKDDIKKVIEFLQKFLQESPEFDASISEGAFSMFDDKEEGKVKKKDKDESKIIVEEY